MASAPSEAGTKGAAAECSASLADTIVTGRSLVLATNYFISTLVLATASSIVFASWLWGLVLST